MEWLSKSLHFFYSKYRFYESINLRFMVFAIIYKTTCLVNGKIYIGQRIIINQNTLDRYYIGSGGRHLKNAIKKHGLLNFKREILHIIRVNNRKVVDKLEEFYIKKYDAMNPEIGYNKMPGTVNGFGNGSPMMNPEVAKRVTDMLRGRKGAKRSEAGKLNMKAAAKRSWENADERRKQMADSIRRSMTSERIEKMRNFHTGKFVSDDTRKLISKNHADFSGEKHPLYGSRYFFITDGVNNKRADLGSEIPDGWIKGKVQSNSNKYRKI